ncbi:MAG: glycosyltransferase [Flavobacteriales bacterium]
MEKRKRIVVSVSNDLVTDQRVKKVCHSLYQAEYQIYLIGRKRKLSPDLPNLPYACKRFNLFFETGFLFYAELNIRLFFFLLFIKADAFHANDLDTLFPNYLVAKLRRKPLIYDTHEYFTGVPEIQHRPVVKKVWTFLEAAIFPRLKHVFTVNDSIAELYFKDYGVRPEVIRNVPDTDSIIIQKNRIALDIPDDKFIVVLQGNGINIHRGAEEAVLAMKSIQKAVLFIIGSGDAIPAINELISQNQLEDKVRLIPRLPYSELMQYTANANIGLSLDKDNNINYRFSLPNKVFDYLNAGIPILGSRLPEIEKIINETKAGLLIDQVDEISIASVINQLIQNTEQYQTLKTNAVSNSNRYSWKNEVKPMLKVYNRLV